jgi:IS5 family transposase
VDAANPGVLIKHRGWIRSMSDKDRQQLKRRQAVEPVIGHLKADQRMARCWLKGSIGDAINTVLAAAGFYLRWLMWAQVRLLFLLANISALA